MLNIQELFRVPGYEEWQDQLKRDLSAEDFDKLTGIDAIEDVKIIANAHSTLLPESSVIPGNFPYTRGFNKPNNHWNTGVEINVQDIKAANTKALDVLMKGCDLLIFDLGAQQVRFEDLFDGIGLEYIETHLIIQTIEQWEQIHTYFNGFIPAYVKFRIDPLSLEEEGLTQLVSVLKKNQAHVFGIEGKKVLACGSNAFQELAFSLSAGHHILFKLMEAGLTCDEAAACIHFTPGIGSNYFIEIAKFRALRTLWANVIHAYEPSHQCSYNCHITAHTIPLNKSLRDPYTNLLRQTTEGMSAVAGGVQSIVIHPYDASSANGTTPLAERMALNISLLLKEESHMDAVNDPLGGSYAVEILTNELCENAWDLFKQMETTGGISHPETVKFFNSKVDQKRQQRIDRIKNGKHILIGMNKFPDKEERNVSFKERSNYLGLEELIIERDVIPGA